MCAGDVRAGGTGNERRETWTSNGWYHGPVECRDDEGGAAKGTTLEMHFDRRTGLCIGKEG